MSQSGKCEHENAENGADFATRAAIYKEGLFGGLEKSLKKYPKKSKNTEKIPQKVRKSIFLDFFGYFSRLFSRPPKGPFLGVFCDFGPGGPRDSCKWRLGSQG